ncbi:MAG TPA: nucleotidyltransferase family protein [Ignavibacteriaceae bacterium]|nr:nucleotidyltransferase family protein [Ignavibacterium sp.]HMN24919.1 nucleotidyltransferase family protein [Ignavibacteriaceae bacterium]HRP94528.1 nucleotidyltransferase family protein [Ignavibacteriaceae bacterium]
MKQYTANEIFELLKVHKALLKKYKVNKIGLFGSHSRNDADNKSDIDLLVEFDEKTFDNFIELVFELERLFGKKVDLLTEEGISPYILPYIKNEIMWYEAR